MRRFKAETGGWRRAQGASADAAGLCEVSTAADEGKRAQKAIEATAVRLLARREHSVEELRRKLASRGYPESDVDAVLIRLQAKRLVSDDRFVSSFVHHHAQRGQGPIRIRMELLQQGIPAEVIDSALETADFDWNSRAQAARQRKFGATPPRNLPERAKQARFLQYRGFSSDQIRTAFQSESYDSVTDADAALAPDPEV